MTNEEDYLDGLLSSITQKKSDIEEQKSREESDLRKKYEESTRLSPDDDFLKETGLSDYRPSAVDRKNLRKPVVIITSNYHMERSVNRAEEAGFTYIICRPAPSDPVTYPANVMWEVLQEINRMTIDK